MNAYIDLIRWEDKLYAHRYFLAGVKGLLRCYAKLQELQEKTEKKPEEEKELADSAVNRSTNSCIDKDTIGRGV